RAAAFDEADADLVVLARGVESGAAAALAPGGDCGLDLNAAKAALGKRFDNLLALPSEVGLVLPMLELAAAAAAEMAAGGLLALGAGAEHLDQLGPAAGDTGAHLFARQRVGRVDWASLSLSG